MPSFTHESLVFLFQQHAELAPALLRTTRLTELPTYVSSRLLSGDLSQLVPTEYRADAVVLLDDNGQPRLAIVVEVQLLPDERKRYTWPHYQTAVRAAHECEVVLLVVTPYDSTARWARRPVQLGGGNGWQPLVVALNELPPIDDAELTRRCPELGVLAVMAHGHDATDRALTVATSALSGLASVTDDELRMLYFDLIDAHLSEAARKELNMIPQGYRYQSPFGNQRFAEGKAAGKAEGLAEGQAEGLAVGQRALLRRQLELRFGALAPEDLSRLSAANSDDLVRWAERILTSASLSEVWG